MDMTETDETEWPPHLEALVAAPTNHRLLHEDDEARVLEITVQPGERENLHHHRWPSIMVVLARPRKGMRSRRQAERRRARRCLGQSACRRSGHMPSRSPSTRHIRFAGSGSNSGRRKHRCHNRTYRDPPCAARSRTAVCHQCGGNCGRSLNLGRGNHGRGASLRLIPPFRAQGELAAVRAVAPGKRLRGRHSQAGAQGKLMDGRRLDPKRIQPLPEPE
jgi:hypothetical protein